MATPAQITANQANSKHSTGPASADGKARSSRNSFKHGLYSKSLVLPNEDPAELDRLRAALRAEHQPINTTEEILVNELAENFWRLRRMREREASAMLPDNFSVSVELGLLVIIQRTMASAERGFHRSLAALRRIQKDRGFVPQPSEAAEEEIGFVPQDPEPPANPSRTVQNIGFVSQGPGFPAHLSSIPEEFLPFLDESGALKPGNSAALSAHLRDSCLKSFDRLPKAD